MKYIVYNKETLRVRKDGILDKEPISITANLGVARAETVPNGDILTVTNIKAQTEKYLAKQSKEVEIVDEETGETYKNVIYEDVELEREYFTCEVVATSFGFKQYKAKRIFELKNKLYETDYITNKLSEVVAESLLSGDNSKLSAFMVEYSKELTDRKMWRLEINSIEKS